MKKCEDGAGGGARYLETKLWAAGGGPLKVPGLQVFNRRKVELLAPSPSSPLPKRRLALGTAG